MEKKIIALALVLVLMVTAFVGCGQKHKTTKVNGQDLLLETGADGEIVTKDDQFVVVVTDRDGEIITYENGENQTYYVDIPGSMVMDGYTFGEHYKIKLLDGWTATDYDIIYKDGTDGKSYIKLSMAVKKFGKGEDINTYLEKVDAQDQQIIDTFADEKAMAELIKTNPDIAKFDGCTYTVEKKFTTITKDNISCQARVHKAVDKDGKVIHYVENYYFMSEGTLFKLDYACEDGAGYDADFNFQGYAAKNVTFVK